MGVTDSDREAARLEWESRRRKHRCPLCPWAGMWIPGELKLCPKCGDEYVTEED